MSWIENVHKKASLIIDQISAARSLAIANGLDPIELSKPYTDLLNALYTEELPYAKLMDESDLIVRLQGPAVETDSPNIAIVGSTLTGLRTNLQKLAKTILGLPTRNQLDAVEFDLTGLARGSLVVGLQIKQADTPQLDAFGNEAQFEEVRQTIRKLAILPQYIHDDGIDDEKLRELMPDPVIRDAAIIATRSLSPSGRSGVQAVSLANNAQAKEESLTAQSRYVLGKAIDAPVKSKRIITVRGVLREIDLDASRFELKLENMGGRLRCVHNQIDITSAQLWLDRLIEVTGHAEFLGERPRLLQVERISVVEEPRNGDLDI